MKKTLTLGITLLFAASCGPLNEGRSNFGSNIIKGLTSKAAAPAAPAGLPPEVMAAGPGNIMLVTIRARGAVAPMVRAATNDSRVTWTSPGKISMTFDNDILISTRGLGDDLMGADVVGVRSAIAAGSGTTTRRQSYLNSLDQIVTDTMTCTYARADAEEVALITGPKTLSRVNENCKGQRLIFDNIYWLNADGSMAKSRQAIAASQGYIDAEPL